jgi:hypothetical protein
MFVRIRFNKKHTGEHDVWRIFVGEENSLDEVQYNVANFSAQGVDLESNSTFEDGERKWNVCCRGEVAIVNGNAYIRGEQR